MGAAAIADAGLRTVDLRWIARIFWLNRLTLGVLMVTAFTLLALGGSLYASSATAAEGPMLLKVVGMACVAIGALNFAMVMATNGLGEYDKLCARGLLWTWIANLIAFGGLLGLTLIKWPGAAELELALQVGSKSATDFDLRPVHFLGVALIAVLASTALAWIAVTMRPAPGDPCMIDLRMSNLLHGHRTAERSPASGIAAALTPKDKFNRQQLRLYHALCALVGLIVLIYTMKYALDLADPKVLGYYPWIFTAFAWLAIMLWIAYHAFGFFAVPSKSAYDAVRNDRRPHVAWLRSFADEGDFGAQNISRRPSAFWLLNWMNSKSKRPEFLTDDTASGVLEELIVGTLGDVGPVIGIGNPRDDGPRTGVARTYLKQDEWKSTAGEILGRAGLIVVLAGTTGGLEWEYREVIKRGLVSRLVVIVPEEERVARLTVLRSAFTGSPWQQVLASERMLAATALTFLDGGGIVSSVSSFGDQIEVEAAVIHAIHASIRARDGAGANAA